LAVVAAVGYFGWQYLHTASASDDLTASGTIESRTTTLSAELSARVLDVAFEEGQEVQAGQVLAKLDDSALQAQYAQAQAAQQAAQANYDLLAAGPTDEQVRQAQAALIIATDSYSRTLAGSRQTDIDAAQAALNAATEAYNKVKAGPQEGDYAAAEAAYQNAEAALKQAQFAYDATFKRDPAGINASPAALALEQATNNYNAAKATYDKLAQSPDNAQISAAYQQVETARAALAKAKTPALDYDIEQSKAQVEQAQAGLDALKAGTRKQQLDAAQAQVDQAKAAVKAIEVQLAKVTISAPSDGVILDRSIEPGEMAAAGAPLFELGHLDKLEITVYLPEEKFALVKPGDTAQVHVDAYPERTFSATVLRIADQAEYTPRNVQTVEGRKDTVFAIRLSLDNADLSLKPGMPADVTFGQK
jgi:multidrug resistance efflux pump